MKHRSTKACEISQQVRRKVHERDDGLCVVCGRVGYPNAHYIRRSQLGLGIEQNVVSLCVNCHHEFDNGSKGLSKEIGEKIKAYLQSIYPDWNEQDLIYKKGM